eukprot:Gb_36715 [translate_table: standard]
MRATDRSENSADAKKPNHSSGETQCQVGRSHRNHHTISIMQVTTANETIQAENGEQRSSNTCHEMIWYFHGDRSKGSGWMHGAPHNASISAQLQATCFIPLATPG